MDINEFTYNQFISTVYTLDKFVREGLISQSEVNMLEDDFMRAYDIKGNTLFHLNRICGIINSIREGQE